MRKKSVESQVNTQALDNAFHQKLRDLIRRFAPTAGDHYFHSLVRDLAETLQFRYAMVGVLNSEREILARAFYANGKITKNIKYPVAGTPCENVVTGELCLYPQGVQKLFPLDKELIDLGVEGYLGIPLLNLQTGKPMGLLSVMHDEPILDSTSILAILKIFSGRAEAEFNRQQLEHNLSQILSSVGEGIYGLDLSGKITFINPAAATMLGYKAEELIDHKAHALLHHSKPDGTPYKADECPIYRSFRDGKIHSGSNETFWRKDGSRFPIEFESTPIIEDGKLQGAVVAFKNITHRKEYEIKLLESEERLDSILKFSPTVIYIKDIQGRYTAINAQYEALFNVKNSEVQGKTDLEIFPSEIAEQFMANDRRVFQTGAPLEIEEVAPHPDGPHTYISTKFPLRDSQGEIYGLCGISLDITERKRAEEQLRLSQKKLQHAEKMSAVGKLSASIAHEFNNPIYGIRNVLEKLREESALSSKEKGFVGLAINECNRISNLITKLQDFNRPSNDRFEMVDIHEIIDDMLMLEKRKFQDKKIKLIQNYAAKVPKIRGVPDQIRQVILNLLQNAEDAASGDGGVISISTRALPQSVQIEVEDNGCGIPAENNLNIFEPFFTTKPSVKGTGLGLSISYGIIEAHGGAIEVQSTEGTGSCFLVTLPRAQD